MQNHTATVVRDDVRDALRHLSRDRTPGRTPLSQLQVVERAVARSGMRPSSGAKEYELARLLAETVESELDRLRGTLRSRSPGASADICDRLRSDFGSGHRELESWSAVYHLYVRPDLNLDLDELQIVLGDRHRRTLQRRLQEGVTALSMHLQSLEHRAASSARRERLAWQLPDPSPERLIARAHAVSRVRDLLAEDRVASVVAIGGLGGVGKTSVAQAVACAEIEDGSVSEMVWLEAEDVGTSGALRRAERGPSPDGDPSRRGPSARGGHACMLVVVDGLDEPIAAAEAAVTMAALRPRARILFTGRVGWPCCENVRPVVLEPLGRASALALLKRLAAERGLQDVARTRDELLEPLVDATSGLPLALRIAAARLRAVDGAQVAAEFVLGEGKAADLCRDLWDPAWDRASSHARCVVGSVAHLSQHGAFTDTAAVRDASRLAPAAAAAALQEAVDLGLLDVFGDASRRSFRTWPFMRRYLAVLARG